MAGTDETAGQTTDGQFETPSDVSDDNPYVREPDTEFGAVADLSKAEAEAQAEDLREAIRSAAIREAEVRAVEHRGAPHRALD
ncbi:hypothetical protein C471_14500 [Halorubrum saccharovorum DSM 1137]|uniref:Uncharacterized protein n=1 Tax=Halorubrum saccharovorum DSM 1137 TaxID=1227484 RepID=M0DPD8_9EURY|nr:hypothetical protein [Halorubrum saccharovorum]ELZ36537.1 hypothetical protein C471_14500 [Halorubrum saccharovorum DSM 1137]